MSINKQRDALLLFLRRIKEGRAEMASLRCALVKSRRHRAWPLIARFGGIGDEHENLVVQTIAGLYATHSMETVSGNFGDACRRLMSDDESRKLFDPKEIGPVAHRFQHLLAAERGSEINERVVRFVLRLKTADIAVNYADLYDGLLCWGDKIRNHWAGSFWHAPELEEAVI